MSKFIDLTGQKFGRLTVIRRMNNDKYGRSMWLCQCNCKNEIIAQSGNLKNGHTKSCGCLNEDNHTKHGHLKNKEITRTYKSWRSMIQRCTNPNNPRYNDYGGRGITVCKRWRNSFPNFLEDMGERPPGLTLERKGNNKGYYKSNCKWATPKEQNRNSRHNHLITYDGKTQCIVAWSEEIGINITTIHWRLDNGWSVGKALTTPVRKRRKKNEYNSTGT